MIMSDVIKNEDAVTPKSVEEVLDGPVPAEEGPGTLELTVSESKRVAEAMTNIERLRIQHSSIRMQLVSAESQIMRAVQAQGEQVNELLTAVLDRHGIAEDDRANFFFNQDVGAFVRKEE